ncbi:MAG: type II and III secretion system protein family protein [Panacagrimonas sp.]
MSQIWSRPKTLSTALLAAATLCLSAIAAPESSDSPAPVQPMMEVELGMQKLIHQREGVQRVAVGDPSIADVNVINHRALLVTGKKVGLTSLMVWPRTSAVPRQYRVRVGGVKDPEALSEKDPELADAKIARGGSLQGQLPNLLAHRRAKVAATPLEEGVSDSSQVQGDMQVLTEIKIAEVSRTTLQAYGAQYFKNVANTTAGIAPPGTLTSIEGGDGGGFTLNSQSGFLPVAEAFNLVFGDATRGFLGVLSVLERKGLARVLAEPSLTAMSGQTASFLAGGEFPVPVNQGQNGSISVEYKEFGVRLALTPTVLSPDRIALKVAPEVSDLDFNAGIQIGGVAVPALTVRRTDTAIELGNGESFVISGLVSNNVIANVDKVPWLGDIPILGAFFKSASNQRTEKELIMVVTPHLVRPLAREAQLPALPGSKYDDYRPGFGALLAEETGEFDTQAFGFSR